MFVAVLLLPIACFIVFCYRLIYKPRQIYQALRAQSIPGERFVPIIGQIRELRKHFQADRQMEYQLSLQRKYGDCFLLPIGPVVNLVIMDPDLISDILTKASSCYTKPKLFRAQFGPVAGSVNLVIAEGETHARIREMLNPAFHFVNLKSLVSIMSKKHQL